MSRIVLAQIEPRAVRLGLGGLTGLEDLGTGRWQSVLRAKRGCSNDEKRERNESKEHPGGEIMLVRAKLQTVRHLEDCREDAVNNEADHDRDEHDNDRRNQGRDDIDGAI